jgi:4-diphosphocytidyl-2-C-methyl-D-erythritol kinase
VFGWITRLGESDWILDPSLVLLVISMLLALAVPRPPLRPALWEMSALWAFIFFGVGTPSLVTAIVKRMIGRSRPEHFEAVGAFDFRTMSWLDWTYQSFVRLDLYKRIPIAAGFAGGSADAAATLLALNRLWKLGFDDARLATIGARLGSDVPFCLRGGTAYGSGRGEQLDSLPHLPETTFLLVFPKFPISAEWAYSQLNMGLTRRPRTLSMDRLKTILTQYPKAAQVFHNRLEDAVAPAHPRVAEITFQLLQSGASVAMMSGSGSGIYGVFADRHAAQVARAELGRTDWPSWVVHSQRKGVEFFSNE